MPNTSLQLPLRVSPYMGPTLRGPEEVDQALIQAIQAVTERDKNFWSQPQEYDRRGAGHRFFQYPAMMLPMVQRKLIELIKLTAPNTRTLLDPFMGSGTALVAGMLNGLDCYGQDINPMSILLSKVKVGAFSEAAFKKAAKITLDRVRADTSVEVTASFRGIDKWFHTSVAQELSRLVRSIRKEPRRITRQVFWVTLAETVRLTSNDRTSTFKMHARPLDEIETRKQLSPVKVFEALLAQNLADMALYAKQLDKQGLLRRRKYAGQVSISVLNSTNRINLPQPLKEQEASLFCSDVQGFDLLVTSPPYGDNKTTVPYGQHAYLPLQWIDFEDIDNAVSRDSLKTIAEIDTRSLGGQLGTVTERDQEVIVSLSPSLKVCIDALKARKSEEIKKVVCFVRDLNIVLERCASAVRTNGYLVFTIGNRMVSGVEILNNLILKELLAHCKVEQVHRIERSIQNKRMAARNKSTTTMTKEDILIFRKN